MLSYLLISCISGIMLALAWPSQGWPFLLLIAFVPILYVEEEIVSNKTIKRKSLSVFLCSVFCFIIFNSYTIRWLYFLQNDDGGKTYIGFLFPWIVNSLLMSLVFMSYHLVHRTLGRHTAYLYLPCGWVSFELLHHSWDLQWPWLSLGNGFSEYYKYIQWYEITGALGGSLWILCANMIVFYFFISFLISKNNRLRKNKLLQGLLIFLVWVLIPMLASLYRYHSYKSDSNHLKVAALQPNEDPYTSKFKSSENEIVDRLSSQMERAINQGAQIIVAPETAIPGRGYMDANTLEQNELLFRITKLFNRSPQISLLTGASLVRYYQTDPKNKTATLINPEKYWVDAYNAALFYNNQNWQQYYKSKLVIGVENIPFKPILMPIIHYFIQLGGPNISSIAIQENPSVFRTENGLKIAPIICYESVFGEYVSEFIKQGAQIIAIATNDGWWQTSDGHRQHLSYARLRAIENRRSIVRSANTGISALINEKGDITQAIPYGYRDILIGEITYNSKKTHYTQKGDFLARLGLMFSVIILSFTLSQQLLKRIKTKKNTYKGKRI